MYSSYQKDYHHPKKSRLSQDKILSKNPFGNKNSEHKYYMSDKNTKKKSSVIRPESLPNIVKKGELTNDNTKNKLNNDMREEKLNDELGLLQVLWDDLGITLDYRILFENHVKGLDDYECKDVIDLEKNNLKKFREALLKLSKEIRKREKNLQKLINLDESIENSCNEGKIISDSNLNEVVILIKSLRLNAVNVVNYYFDVNQKASSYLNSGKIDISKINKLYSYSPNYIYKMKEDLKFLKNSILNRFFELQNTEINAFLTNCASNKNTKSNKIVIPISDDLMKEIKNCRYLLLQEILSTNPEKNFTKNDTFYMGKNNFRKLRSVNDKNFKNNFDHISSHPNTRKLDKLKNDNILNLSQTLHKYKLMLGKDYNKMFFNSKIRNLVIERNAQININYQFTNFINDSNTLKKNSYRKSLVNKIKVEHDEIESMTKEEFLKSLERYKNISMGNNFEENKIRNFNGNDQDDYMKKIIEEEKMKNIIESKKRLKLENENNRKFQEDEIAKDKNVNQKLTDLEIKSNKIKNKDEKTSDQEKGKGIKVERDENNLLNEIENGKNFEK